MAVAKKTFAEWCAQFEIAENEAASIVEAAAVELTDELTEVQFREIAPQTVEDFLKYASNLKKDERAPFCEKFGLDFNDLTTQAEFAEKLAQYSQEQESSKPEPKSKPPAKPEPAKPSRLRVTGCTVLYNHKQYPAGSLLPQSFPDSERNRLLKLGAVEEV